ncbi:MAG: DUF2309 family protein, partial [Planctomycetales bacterium]|nr:DUF2309 family protein [Planctomycetales bacterium]
MSIVNKKPYPVFEPNTNKRSHARVETQGHQRSDSKHITDALEQVQKKIAPVWPLQDYVAVNPYAGHSDQKFLAARRVLQSLSDLETLMPL